VEIGGLPGIDIEAARTELVEVPLRFVNTSPWQPIEPIAPTQARAEFAEDDVRGLSVVGGDLKGEDATIFELGQQVVEELPVIVDPVEAGVPATFCRRALPIISSEVSMPVIRARGQRSSRLAVSFPGPQPRSMMVEGSR
jgi:hypothetical protein